MKNSLISVYENSVFKYPKLVLLVIALLVAILSQYATNFRLDASSDSLVLENDQSLKYYREVVSKYNTAEFLVLTYSPLASYGALFSDQVLADLSSLRERLLTISNIKSIVSILDVPLTQSPPLTLAELNGAPQLLLDEKTDRAMARKELSTSQLYRDLLISPDFSTTAVVISLHSDDEVSALLNRRNKLRELRANSGLNPQQAAELEKVTLSHQAKAAEFQRRQDQLIENVRGVVSAYEDKATIFLGGLPMIVTDSISYIRGDVVVFGSAAILVIILILTVAFRQTGWVMMPLITCATTGYTMICVLGLLNWPISVVSSNFLSLLLIITLSLNIHLIVRYRELANLHPDQGPLEIVRVTIRSKFIPCLYTSLTTIVAFGSLVVSGIRPVIDFGYIMCVGIVISLLVTFTLFPSLALVIKPKSAEVNSDPASKLILALAKKLYDQTSGAAIGFVIAAIVAGYGLANLTVENRFIDYFKPDTEIYQGMHQIDAKLGGTTPLDIIIDAPADFFEEQEKYQQEQARISEERAANADQQDYDDDFADFEDDLGDDFSDFAENGVDATDSAAEQGNLAFSSYWFNETGLQQVRAIQASLEALPETGKVLSLATSMSIFDNLKNAEPMDNIDLGFLYNVLSEENKNTLFVPYMSEDGNQIHISIRVFESHKGLDRNKLIDDIRQLLITQHGIADEQINITGMLVLYNNMLNSLFSSQILTLGTVFLVILLMFIVLFRNIKLALITLVPNLFSAAVVLGLMGIFTIPLDLMTITIAAISVGIAVDNSIHFVARFRDEFSLHNHYSESIDTATNNVGQAMFYTTMVITAGFLIMVFSNFVPTMYFGILTAIAMVTALIANLIMLPILLARFKPLTGSASAQ
ncbi:MAG: MMPL family transporter [Gammaproteobacteria bacterium]|nr:MMPL family transporter [Gammaproteobacteria bacterium]